MSELNPDPEKTTHFGFLTIPEREKVEWVRRHFDTIAYKYDYMNTLLSLGVHYQWKRIAVRMMGLGQGQKVIDVCGGTGDLSRLAAQNVGRSGSVVLYDINWEMMAAGRPKTVAAACGDRVCHVQGDAEKIGFPDETFDAAMVGFGIRNLTHFEKGFAEMHRVLKKGGVFMCLEFSQPVTPWFRSLYDFYSFHLMPFIGKALARCGPAYCYLPESIRLFPGPDKLKTIIENMGFRNVAYRRLTNGIAVVHVGKKGDGAK